MTRELQSTFDAAGISWPAMRNYIACMVHVSQVALGAFMRSLGVKGHTKSWEDNQRNQQFGENECTDIGYSQTMRKKTTARINKVSAMSSGLAKIIEKV